MRSESAVFLHHESVVWRRYQQHIEYAPLHQFAEGCVFEVEAAQGLLVHRWDYWMVLINKDMQKILNYNARNRFFGHSR